MNENINLCQILKGLEGIELYSTIHGKVILKEVADTYTPYPIRCTIVPNNKTAYFTSEGKYFLFVKEANAECMLFPSATERDWSKYERPIPVDTPMMCRNKSTTSWILCTYKHYFKGRHYVKYIRNTCEICDEDFNYMIPYNKFNPNNIEESLKYNIQNCKS